MKVELMTGASPIASIHNISVFNAFSNECNLAIAAVILSDL